MYDTAGTPTDIVQEDLIIEQLPLIERLPLPIAPGVVTICPVESMFER